MSDDEKGYQGWANYPTWAVNLWLANDQGLYDMTLEATADEYDDAENCIQVRDGIWTLEQARRFNTADRLREMVEELSAQIQGDVTASFVQDLYGWALEQVDWHEIADSWLGSYVEGLEYA